MALVRYLVRQGYRGNDIAVVTPYVGQLLHLRASLRKETMVMVSERDEEELAELEERATGEGPAAEAAPSAGAPSAQLAVTQSTTLSQQVRLATIDK